MLSKICRKCGKDTPYEQLRRLKIKPDGVDNICKTCHNARSRVLDVTRQQRLGPMSKDTERTCRVCGKVTPYAQLAKRNGRRIGVQNLCKSCHSAYSREWKLAHPVQTLVSRKKTCRAHREQNRIRTQQFHRNNPHYSTAYRLAHPDLYRITKQRRRARERGLPSTFTEAEWLDCLDYWHSCCAYCGSQQGILPNMKLTADHFVALADQRPDNPGTVAINMLPACQPCNFSKNDADALTWLNWKFGKRKAKSILNCIRAYFERLENHG